MSKIEIIAVVILSIAGLVIGMQMGTADGKEEAAQVYQK